MAMPFGVNPKSIIRRTATGTTRVVIAATVSEITASMARPRYRAT